ncbi:hypothetical protein M4D79_19075 [Mycolicibacterium novocastrense]|nr:hypothetical protein M4D79_19075 [Mycolicibacterium novocastrense]
MGLTVWRGQIRGHFGEEVPSTCVGRVGALPVVLRDAPVGDEHLATEIIERDGVCEPGRTGTGTHHIDFVVPLHR